MRFNLWTVAILMTLMLAASACGTNGNAQAKGGYTSMTPQALQAEMDAGEKLVIVDLREPELYRAGHIPGAENIPFDQFNDRTNELDPQANIVLVCHTGPMGDISGALLASRGFHTVRNLSGGMAAWRGQLTK